MSNHNIQIDPRESSEEISLKDVILSIREWINYLLSKWYIIVIVGIIGASVGLTYAIWKKPDFVATTSFVLETGKEGGLGGYAGIASSFGISVGGGGGLFQDENIMELYRSRRMLSQTLLTPIQPGSERPLLIDRFIELNEYREKWNENPRLKNIQFKSNNDYGHNTQTQIVHDSIIGRFVNDIIENYLEIEKKDKEVNIISVVVRSADELFSKSFNKALVENVNEFYLDTKTKGAEENIAILQMKVDSVRGRLSGTINKAAAVADATPNQNPTRMAQRVAPIENAKADAEINQGVLGTLLQNLELSKISLLKEKPLIQIVDEPILPLTMERFGKIKGIIIGGFLACFLVSIFLSIKKIIRDALEAT